MRLLRAGQVVARRLNCGVRRHMKRIAWLCSATALCSAALAYSVIRLRFPSIGFESAIWFGAALFWLSLLASVVAVVLCIVSFVRTRSPMVGPFLCAVAAGLVLSVTARS
jgi:hypothetical protein